MNLFQIKLIEKKRFLIYACWIQYHRAKGQIFTKQTFFSDGLLEDPAHCFRNCLGFGFVSRYSLMYCSALSMQTSNRTALRCCHSVFIHQSGSLLVF